MSMSAETGHDVPRQWPRPALLEGIGAEAMAGAVDESSAIPLPPDVANTGTSQPEDAISATESETQPNRGNAPPAQPHQEAEPVTEPEPEREVLVTFDAYRRLLDGRGLSLRDVRPENYRPVAEATVTYVAGVMRRINQIRLSESTPDKPVKPIRTLYAGVIGTLNNFYRELDRWPAASQARHRKAQREIHLPVAQRHASKIAELHILTSLVRQIDENAKVPNEFAGAIDAIDDVRMAYGQVITQVFRSGTNPRHRS